MRRKIIAGNWKMNGSVAFMQSYLNDFKQILADKKILESEGVSVVLAPPSVFLSQMKLGLQDSSVQLSAQNVSSYDDGAYTGDISSGMLADIECEWCLVGHSERRSLFGETDALVVEKVRRLLAVNVKPILCVGETLEERESGQAELVVYRQLGAVLNAFSEVELKELVVAYEPVWAIGTGKTATPEQAQLMHESIRARVEEKSESLAAELVILYGGSVNSGNAKTLFSQKDIDGGLVGGASLKVEEFSLICEQLV